MENPLNKVSEVGDVISRAVSVASTKKEQILRQIINGALLFVILLVFGCLDFATLTFHGEYLATANYWGTTFSKTVAGICAFNIGINLMWEIELKRDYILAFAVKKYEILKKQITSEFEYFCKLYNKHEKKKAYVDSINKRLFVLNKLSRRKDRLLYSSTIPEGIENYEEEVKKLQKLKESNKYCIKRAELEALKVDEYVDKNIDSLPVRYMEVFPEVFELEIDGSITSRGTKTKGNTTIGKIKATGSMIFGMVGFSMFVTSFGLSLDGQQFASQMEAFWHYLLKCAEDIAIILWQTSKGLLKARKIISSEITEPYVGRNKVLLAFLQWKLENQKISLEDYNKVISDINNVTIDDIASDDQSVTLTEEQYKELINHK